MLTPDRRAMYRELPVVWFDELLDDLDDKDKLIAELSERVAAWDKPCDSCSGDAGHESGGPQGWVPDPCTCHPARVQIERMEAEVQLKLLSRKALGVEAPDTQDAMMLTLEERAEWRRRLEDVDSVSPTDMEFMLDDLDAKDKLIAELSERNKRLSEACDIFESNSADAVQIWELLRQVYERVGNHAAPVKRHVLPPGLRDAIRDIIYTKKSPLSRKAEVAAEGELRVTRFFNCTVLQLGAAEAIVHGDGDDWVIEFAKSVATSYPWRLCALDREEAERDAEKALRCYYTHAEWGIPDDDELSLENS